MHLPKFVWDLDPVFYNIHFPFPIKYLLYLVAAGGVAFALRSYRNGEKDGAWIGALFAGGAGLLASWVGDLQPDLALRYYSLLFVGVFLGGYSLLKWQVVRGGGDEEDAGDFIVYGVLGVLGGARIGHVLFYDLDKALEDPIWVFKIWTGGLASHGAVLGLIFVMYLFTKSRGIAFLEGSDRFAYSATLGATLVRVGNFFNSEIVGIKTDQSWGVKFPRYDHADFAAGGIDAVPYRHPSQVYETLIGCAIMLALFLADRAWGKEKRPRGALISLYFALYFPARFAIEFVKQHQVFPESSTFDMGHYLSIPGAFIGFYGLWWSFNRKLPVGWRARDTYYEDEQDFADEEPIHDADVEEEFSGKKRPTKRDAEGNVVIDEDAAPRNKKKKKKKKRAAAETSEAVTEAPSADDASGGEAAADDGETKPGSDEE